MAKLTAGLIATTVLLSAIAPLRAADPAYDKVFADRAFAAGLASIAEAKIALDKSGNGNVRKYARRIVDDRSAVNEELAQVAKAEGLGLPTLPTEAEHAEIARLRKLTGDDFDQAYLNDQVAAGKASVALYLMESKTGQDSALKQTSNRALPILNDHVQMAEALAAVR